MRNEAPAIVTDAERILSAYGPVILAAQQVRRHYAGPPMRICPDAVGVLINALADAERTCGVIEKVE